MARSDLAVSVASGTRWLGTFDVEASGPVLLFAGEGGARKLTRRFRAVCEARGLAMESLPIRVCLRVPHLTDEGAMAAVAAELSQFRPRLALVDPLYLAAQGAAGRTSTRWAPTWSASSISARTPAPLSSSPTTGT